MKNVQKTRFVKSVKGNPKLVKPYNSPLTPAIDRNSSTKLN